MKESESYIKITEPKEKLPIELKLHFTFLAMIVFVLVSFIAGVIFAPEIYATRYADRYKNQPMPTGFVIEKDNKGSCIISINGYDNSYLRYEFDIKKVKKSQRSEAQVFSDTLQAKGIAIEYIKQEKEDFK